MRVFISWSGKRSKLIGELLNDWLKCVIQNIDPWYSPQDIDRGAIWFTAIADQLADISTGIICLTRENFEKPWILFESGALTKGLSSSRVWTLLIDIEPSELTNSPLSSFNHSFPDKEGILTLLNSINSRIEKPLDQKTLNNVFDLFWPSFENKFKEIIASTENLDAKPVVENLVTQNDILGVIDSIKELQRVVYNNFDIENQKIKRARAYGISNENLNNSFENHKFPSDKISELLKSNKPNYQSMAAFASLSNETQDMLMGRNTKANEK